MKSSGNWHPASRPSPSSRCSSARTMTSRCNASAKCWMLRGAPASNASVSPPRHANSMDLFDNEPRDTFRRNFLLVVTAHVGLLGTVWLLNRGAATPPPEQITWLDGSAFAAPAPAPAPTRELVAPAEPPPS